MALFEHRIVLLLRLISLATLVFTKTYKTRFPGVTWDDENWRIQNTELVQGEYQSRLSLANGYLGINVAATGPFFEADKFVDDNDIGGWPLFTRRQTFATISGFWDSQPTTNGSNDLWLNQYGGESVISGVPHWAGLVVVTSSGQVLNESVNAKQISSYKTVLDMKSGLHTWEYTWTPEGEEPIDIKYSLFVHKLYINQAFVQLQVTPKNDAKFTIVDVLNGDCAVRTTFADKDSDSEQGQIWTAVHPSGLDNITAYIYSTLTADECATSKYFPYNEYIGGNESSIAQAVNASIGAHQTATFVKYIGGASSDAFEEPQSVASLASWAGKGQGFAEALDSHVREWRSLLPDDSVDDFTFPENGTLPDDQYIIEQQILARTNPFHLLSNTIGLNATIEADNNTLVNTNSLSVGGLGSDSYAGQVFWDADVWMAPGLVVSHPQAAQQIANYRVKQYPQAKANLKTAYQSSQNETGKFSSGGAVYSWTSARFGNCTGTGPCFDYQYHLNGDIGVQMMNYWLATGDTEFWKNELFPVFDSIAWFYAELLTYNETTKKYDLLNATDPDEYANNINNPGYTMGLIKTHLQQANSVRALLGYEQNKTWAERSTNINIPTNEEVGIIVEYDGMNGSVQIKQADVTLLDDIVDFPNPYTLSDLEFYASAQAPDGPGMTYSSYSIVSNAVSPSGCSAYTYNVEGSTPYVRGPWYQFSEQLDDDPTTNGNTKPAFPFLTGMGGANRVAVFGYLGLSLAIDALNIDPQLPPQIAHLDYRTIYWQGLALNATSNQTHTTISRLPSKNLATANSTWTTRGIPVTVGSHNTTVSHTLPVHGSLVIANKQNSFNLTVAGNLAQCRPVDSDVDSAPGQLPIAAIDGSISTAWQPADPNKTASITVDLSAQRFQQVTRLYFDWAHNPPVNYSVYFSNASSLDKAAAAKGNVLVASVVNVTVSNPYNPERAFIVKPYESNTTNQSIAGGVWSGRYAILTIEGQQTGDKSAGATVAEWAIIGTDASDLIEKSVYRPRSAASLEAILGRWWW